MRSTALPPICQDILPQIKKHENTITNRNNNQIDAMSDIFEGQYIMMLSIRATPSYIKPCWENKHCGVKFKVFLTMIPMT